jgi:hypothetical protein
MGRDPRAESHGLCFLSLKSRSRFSAWRSEILSYLLVFSQFLQIDPGTVAYLKVHDYFFRSYPSQFMIHSERNFRFLTEKCCSCAKHQHSLATRLGLAEVQCCPLPTVITREIHTTQCPRCVPSVKTYFRNLGTCFRQQLRTLPLSPYSTSAV